MWEEGVRRDHEPLRAFEGIVVHDAQDAAALPRSLLDEPPRIIGDECLALPRVEVEISLQVPWNTRMGTIDGAKANLKARGRTVGCASPSAFGPQAAFSS